MGSSNQMSGAMSGSQALNGIDLSVLAPGFTDPVHDSQSVFRVLLDALSRPGRIMTMAAAMPGLTGVEEVPSAVFAALLALADYTTPVMLQNSHRGLSDALRFHTGAPLTTDPAEAVFAYLNDAEALPSIDSFSLGEPEMPERAATLFIRVESLDAGPTLVWRGPGIRDAQAVRIAGLPTQFWHERAALASRFPCGIDCYFVAGDALVGLPRTTQVEVS